jgi:hypothetical protein
LNRERAESGNPKSALSRECGTLQADDKRGCHEPLDTGNDNGRLSGCIVGHEIVLRKKVLIALWVFIAAMRLAGILMSEMQY